MRQRDRDVSVEKTGWGNIGTWTNLDRKIKITN